MTGRYLKGKHYGKLLPYPGAPCGLVVSYQNSLVHAFHVFASKGDSSSAGHIDSAITGLVQGR